ncbi:MAG: hypothetical protein WC530_09510 [Candidatus Omnitrophota bacterium]|jgi:hypothetical protein
MDTEKNLGIKEGTDQSPLLPTQEERQTEEERQEETGTEAEGGGEAGKETTKVDEMAGNEENKGDSEKEKKELEKTRINKQLFLQAWKKSLGCVADACALTHISESGFYLWKRTDPDFVRDLAATQLEIDEMVEGKLMRLIRREHPPSIRYYLDRRVGKFKPKSQTQIIPLDGNEVEFVDFSTDEEPNQPQQDETESQ